MPKTSLSITEEMTKTLEKRIMKRLLSSVEKIVEKKCRVFFSQNAVKTEPSNDSINQELTVLKNEIQSLQNEVKLLADKTDYTIGSLTYISHDMMISQKKILKPRVTLRISPR